ncbi:Alpha/Beta hydrolase protein [Talaromyces proteolyticus]|uniref:Alpha/Beta hydrolase protein n=1 Tax=Talaromyces proteolyticus TaxID=1131652 RepID=A0AAD4KNM1_9EURO|nr:Alpha/Beta hydrolase protein [Talaromyces proteolyticus]KAH8695617.1 Alpha/Beta hydrolase protein [Talaromyces proteolyticus]
MLDYSQYQGPSEEWKSFVRDNPIQAPDLTLSPQTMRQATNELRVQIAQAELREGDLYKTVPWRDYSVLTRDKQNIIARVYRPSDNMSSEALPIYLYFHGGGHLLGTIETEDASCSRIAANASILVVNINYRHTPEFKHPTQVDDAWDAFEWLSRNASAIGGDPTRVIVGGISAGAGLAASIVIRQHMDSKTPSLTVCGQLLCIPWLIHPDNHPFRTQPTSSYMQNNYAPVLPMSLLQLFTDLLHAEDPADPSLNIALSEEDRLSGLPKSSFLIAGQDLLRDDGLYYADKLARNGIPTKVHVFPGLPHGFRRYSSLPSSRVWDELLLESFKWILSTDNACSFTVSKTK